MDFDLATGFATYQSPDPIIGRYELMLTYLSLAEGLCARIHRFFAVLVERSGMPRPLSTAYMNCTDVSSMNFNLKSREKSSYSIKRLHHLPFVHEFLYTMPSMSEAWISEPVTRGTWGLVQSSFLTTFLYVHTAVYPNIRPRLSKQQMWIERFYITFWACMLPELLLVWAVSQILISKGLQIQLNSDTCNVSPCDGQSRHPGGDKEIFSRKESVTCASKDL